jgi:tRNA dimethylallyltransferase
MYTLCLQLPLEQREDIPHHLIDILDPADEFSAGDFHSLGRKAAEDIIAVSHTVTALYHNR